MWRYLILNSLWFSILFLVHFFGTRRSQIFVLAAVAGAAAYLVSRPGLDPAAWLSYLLYSLLVFWSAYQFKRWAQARPAALKTELELLNAQLERERLVFSQRTRETETIQRQADQITHLCDKIKEMSQSLDRFETFLVFGEALSRDLKFNQMKLIFFTDEGAVEEAIQLVGSDFQGSQDRSVLLKNRNKARADLSSFDRTVVEKLMKDRKSLLDPKAACMAYPVLVQNQVCAALILQGAHAKDFPIFAILIKSFIAEIQRLKLYERVQSLAVTDGLTGVCVRRHLIQRLEEELNRSRRLGLTLSFLMVDVDHFKAFNDAYGHLVGDVVLKGVAETIKKNIREVDLVGRYGGEEFGVFLTETDESGALFVAERIRRAVADKNFRAYDEDLRVTISVGCATCAAHDDASSLMEGADSALYEAKRQGRNRVSLANLPDASHKK